MGFNIFRKKEKYVQKTHFSSLYRWFTDFVTYVQDEVEKTSGWIEHLTRKTNEIEESHKNHIDATRRYFDYAEKWLNLLHENDKKSEKEIEKTKEYILELYRHNKEIIENINEIKKENQFLKEEIKKLMRNKEKFVSQSVTQSVTDDTAVSQMTPMTRFNRTVGKMTKRENERFGDTRVSQDVSQSVTKNRVSDTDIGKNKEEEMDKEEKEENGREHKKKDFRVEENSKEEYDVIKNLSLLNVSEKRVLYLMIHEKRPMSYQKISEKLDMNYSTVKNIIYKLRKKGMAIKDRLNKRGEKEFYLPESIKIALDTD